MRNERENIKMKELFEKWYKTQFQNASEELLKYHVELGYLDNDVNAMWIGFNAGVTLTNKE